MGAVCSESGVTDENSHLSSRKVRAVDEKLPFHERDACDVGFSPGVCTSSELWGANAMPTDLLLSPVNPTHRVVSPHSVEKDFFFVPIKNPNHTWYSTVRPQGVTTTVYISTSTSGIGSCFTDWAALIDTVS